MGRRPGRERNCYAAAVAFRDDREALRARIAGLERDLRDRGPDQAEALTELTELKHLVRETRTRVESDQNALDELSARIDQMAAKLTGAESTEISAPGADDLERVDLADATASDDAAAVGALRSASVRHVKLAIVGGLILAHVVGIVALLRAGPSGEATDFDIATPLPGDVADVDPVAVLTLAKARAPASASLTGLELYYVQDSGRIDLTSSHYSARMSFTFVERNDGPDQDPEAPVGTPLPLLGDQSISTFRADSSGLHDPALAVSMPFLLGQQPVPMPRCSPRALWETARLEGAPEGAVAVLKYESALTLGPEQQMIRTPIWTFDIEGTPLHLRFREPDCALVDDIGRPRGEARTDGADPGVRQGEPDDDSDGSGAAVADGSGAATTGDGAAVDLGAGLLMTAMPRTRTSPRPIEVAIRFDNGSGHGQRVRLLSIRPLAAGETPVRAVFIRVAEVQPGTVYPTTDAGTAQTDTWIEIPAHQSRIITVGPDDRPRYAALAGNHRYEISIERQDGPTAGVVAAMSDGIRHPVRR